MGNPQPLVGSGALIFGNFVLTAAHNIYSRQYERMVEKQECKIYLNANASKFFRVENWMFMDEYKSSERDQLQFDFALIKLKDDP